MKKNREKERQSALKAVPGEPNLDNWKWPAIGRVFKGRKALFESFMNSIKREKFQEALVRWEFIVSEFKVPADLDFSVRNGIILGIEQNFGTREYVFQASRNRGKVGRRLIQTWQNSR